MIKTGYYLKTVKYVFLNELFIFIRVYGLKKTIPIGHKGDYR